MISRKLAAGLATATVGASLAIIPLTAASASATLCTGPGTHNAGTVGTVLVPVAANNNPTCTIGPGLVGSTKAVTTLQSILNQCYAAKLTVDGSLGPKTEAALKNAQRLGGVTQDGIYGTNTRNNMRFPNQDNAGHCALY